MGRRHTVDESSINERSVSEGASREDERISRVATSCRASRYGCGRVLRPKVGAGRRTIAWSSAWHRLRMLHRRDRCGRRCTRRQDRMACYGCDRVQIVSVKHAPVLLVGNFDWIGSAARSLRFTARTAPRLRRHHARPARAAPPSHPWSNRTHKGLRSPQSPLGRAGGAANVVLSAVGGSFGRALA